MPTYVRTLERDHAKVERIIMDVLPSAENGAAMAGPAGPVPAPVKFKFQMKQNKLRRHLTKLTNLESKLIDLFAFCLLAPVSFASLQPFISTNGDFPASCQH